MIDWVIYWFISGLLTWGVAASLNAIAFREKPASSVVAWSITIAFFVVSLIAITLLNGFHYQLISEQLGVPIRPSNRMLVPWAFCLAYLFFWLLRRKEKIGSPAPGPSAFALPAGSRMRADSGASKGSPPIAAHLSANLPSGSTDSTTTGLDQSEEVFWAMALAELAGSRKHGLWAKAYAEAQGNDSLARANYLRWRAQQLIEEHRDASLSEARLQERAVQQAALAQEQARKEAEETIAKPLSSPADMSAFLRAQGYSILELAGDRAWQVTSPSGASKILYGQDALARLVKGLLKQPTVK